MKSKPTRRSIAVAMLCAPLLAVAAAAIAQDSPPTDPSSAARAATAVQRASQDAADATKRALAATEVESEATARDVNTAVQIADAATRDAVIKSTVAVRSAMAIGKDDAMGVERVMKRAALATNLAEQAADRSLRLSFRSDKTAMVSAAAKARVAVQEAVFATVEAARAADKAAKDSWSRDTGTAAAR